MNKQPGQLLPIRLAQMRRFALNGRPVVFAIPMGKTEKELLPNTPLTPDSLEGEKELEREARASSCMRENFRRLEALCSAVWPKDKIRVKMVRTLTGDVMFAMAFVACTSVNDELAPQGETLQQLVDIMREQGFDQKPRWWYLYVS